jgi:hypothetical protein
MIKPEDKEILRGVYLWLMRSDDDKEWERVGIILVSNPLLVAWFV